MLGRGDLGGEGAGLVTLEAAADELVIPGDIGEAPTCTVDRDKSASVADVVLEVLPLFARQAWMVRVEEEGIEFGKVIGVTEGGLDGGCVVKVNGVTPQGLGEHGVVLVGVVVLAFVAEKEDTDGVCANLRRNEAYKD